jgi:predicted RNase H-like nuclease (RuvC/YqgF family)
MADYSTILPSRLGEVMFKLEGLQEDQARASADLYALQQALEQATDDACEADEREKERLTVLLSELQQELETSRQAASQSLQKKIDRFKAPLWICILGAILCWPVMLLLWAHVSQLQRMRDHLPWSDEERNLAQRMTTARRSLEYLEGLTEPRETRAMKQAQREMEHLRSWIKQLNQRIRDKEREKEHLQNQLNAATTAASHTGGTP